MSSPTCFLPLRSNEPSTQAYLDAKLRSYEVCIENGCYDDAYVNAHLIFMYWLYSKLWILTKHDPDLLQRIFSLHSFDSKFDRSKFINASSALDLHQLKLEERKYAEVFGAICLDRTNVKSLKELVDTRNKILHPSGVVIFNSYEELGKTLDVQVGLAQVIADHLASAYIGLVEVSINKKLTYRRLLRWETDYMLEQELFTTYHLSAIDYEAAKSVLRIS